MDKELTIKNITGYISIILFILVGNPFLKLLLATSYILVSFLGGKRIKIVPNITLFISVTVINLLVPQGLILYNLGPIIIAKESLFTGISKSSLLIGLLYLSKNITSSDIKISGRAGLIIRDSFNYFTLLTSGEKIRPKNIINQIDKKLLKLKPAHLITLKTGKNNNKTLIFISIITLIVFTLDNTLFNF